MQAYGIIGLGCGLAYPLGALCLKRALSGGVGPWQSAYTCNLMFAPVFAPLFLLGGAPWNGTACLQAMLLGVLFFAGQILTLFALNQGDVSVATPVLGTKAVWTAVFSALLTTDVLPMHIWWASALATVAIGLLSWTGGRRHGNVRLGLGFGLLAAALYGLTDVLLHRWAGRWGYGRFVPVMFLTISACALSLRRFRERNGALARNGNRAWLRAAAVILAGQALFLSYALTAFGQVTVVNILYSTRVLWSVVLVWAVGHWFANAEREVGRRAMAMRLTGAVCVAVAIFLAVK